MSKGRFTDRKTIRTLFFLCWISYVFTYLGRLNYAACLVEIVLEEGWSKSQAGLIATGFFLFYGLGQLVNGYVGDKLSPKIMVFCGLFSSGLVNFLFPFMGSASLAALLWCINGFVQSMIWSPIVRQLSSWLPAEKRQQACVNMNGTVPVGTLAVYGLSALIIYLGSWKNVFFTSGVLLTSMAFIWFFGISALEKRLVDEETPVSQSATDPVSAEKTLSIAKLSIMSALPLCLLGLFMQGMLKDGVTTWIPTFLEENFGLTAAASILSTTIVPIINLGGVYFGSWVNRKFFRNEVLAAMIFFMVGLAALVLLTFAPIHSAVLSLLLLAVTTTFMMGINTLLASMMPHFFVRFGVCSTVTGLLNSAVYLGSAVSSYGNGAIVEHFGWDSIMKIWCICAVLGILFCGLAVKKWKFFRGMASGSDL